MKKLLLICSHVAALAIGFGLGVYFLPILTAPEAVKAEALKSLVGQAAFSAKFRKDLKGSDFLHWGEGTLSIGPKAIALQGRVSPGPDYKLYLAPEYVEDKEGFLRVKGRSVRLGDVKTFENFIVPVPGSVDIGRYTAVVLWCETFSMFISAAKYR